MEPTCFDDQDSQPEEQPRRSADPKLVVRKSLSRLFQRPFTFVFLIWGLMFLGLGIVLAYA